MFIHSATQIEAIASAKRVNDPNRPGFCVRASKVPWDWRAAHLR